MRVRSFTANLQDSSLQLTVPHVVDIAVLEPSAVNTAYKYIDGWQRWKAWAQSKLGVPVLPTVPSGQLYLTELVERAALESHSASVIESASSMASYSILWIRHLAGMDSPTIHPWVKGVVEGAQRKLAAPVLPKQPLEPVSIAEITLNLGSASAYLADIRFLFII